MLKRTGLCECIPRTRAISRMHRDKRFCSTGSHTWNNLIDMGPNDPPATIDFGAYLTLVAAVRAQLHARLDLGTDDLGQYTDEEPEVAQRRPSCQSASLVTNGTRTGARRQAEVRPAAAQSRIPRTHTSTACTGAEAGVYVSVMLFEGYGVQFQRDAWPNHPMNADNNIQGVDGDKNGDGKGIEIHQLAKKRVTKIQEAYLRGWSAG